MTKLTQFPGGNNPDELKMALREMQKSMDSMDEYMTLIAKITKAKYDALIEEGFTHEDAIELCKNIF